MEKEVLINLELTPKEAAKVLEEFDAEEFAQMLNALGALMEDWRVGGASMQMDYVGMSDSITEHGRYAARMIAKASETN